VSLPLLVLTGETASGKKQVGLAAARAIGAEVIGMDSIKVYRGLSVGAAAASPDQVSGVRLHVVGIAPPDVPFSTGRWVDEAKKAVASIESRGARVAFLGGTSLYLRALIRGFFDGPPAQPEIRARLEAEAARVGIGPLHRRLAETDPDAASRIFPNDLRRICRALEVIEVTGRPITALQEENTKRPFDRPFRVVGLRLSRETLFARIEARVDRMLAEGLIDEVRRLLERDALRGEAAGAIGYREIVKHLRGESTLAEARESIVTHTRALARKQRKWYPRFPEITWIDRGPETPTDELVEKTLQEWTRAE